MVSPNRTQIVIYIVGTLLVADFLIFGYMPSQRRLAALERSRDRQQGAISKALTEAGALASLRETLHDARPILQSQRQRIPNEAAFGVFLNDVSSLMQRHALQDQWIEPGTEHSDGDPVVVPVTLRCQGSFAQLFRFYRDLQDMPRLVRFEEVQFHRSVESEGNVEMVAQVAIFYHAPWEQENHHSDLRVAL